MTVIDLFREFSAVATSDNYSGSSRILYYTLLYIWNERRRPSEVSVARKQLSALTGLSSATLTEATQYLTSRHWIKRFKSRNRLVFVYKLTENRPETDRAAGFRMSPAQSTSKRGLEESPSGDSSVAVIKDTEVCANVRERNQSDNTRADEVVGDQPPETSRPPATNAEVHGDLEIEVPDFSCK